MLKPALSALALSVFVSAPAAAVPVLDHVGSAGTEAARVALFSPTAPDADAMSAFALYLARDTAREALVTGPRLAAYVAEPTEDPSTAQTDAPDGIAPLDGGVRPNSLLLLLGALACVAFVSARRGSSHEIA